MLILKYPIVPKWVCGIMDTECLMENLSVLPGDARSSSDCGISSSMYL